MLRKLLQDPPLLPCFFFLSKSLLLAHQLSSDSISFCSSSCPYLWDAWHYSRCSVSRGWQWEQSSQELLVKNMDFAPPIVYWFRQGARWVVQAHKENSESQNIFQGASIKIMSGFLFLHQIFQWLTRTGVFSTSSSFGSDFSGRGLISALRPFGKSHLQ